jgi:hypothetical protein
VLRARAEGLIVAQVGQTCFIGELDGETNEHSPGRNADRANASWVVLESEGHLKCPQTKEEQQDVV